MILNKMVLYTEIKKSLDKFKIKRSSIVYISGNIFNLGLKKKDLKIFCEFFFSIIKKKISNSGGIIVPTATLNIANTKKIYTRNTPSYMMGVFSEYVRKKEGCNRSNHPLWSFAGIGKNVEKLLKNVPISAYGYDSIFERLLNYNTYFICFGKPDLSLAMLHYVENLVGVPYRYNKEFLIRCKFKGKIIKKKSILGVRYNSKYNVGDENKKIMNYLNKKKIFKKISFRKDFIYICNYADIVKTMCTILSDRPTIWLKNEKINQKKILKF
ncbi:AAC(3) family N-acetyltransferase [Candidatus Pelagibacter ubique]|nr:AAC(3) family N-acetyltransferase [Candidatus Pelagibacter ubique]